MNTISTQQPFREHLEQHHISLLYDTSRERLEFLANYLQVGFERHELCMIVGHQSQRELARDLQSVGLVVDRYIKQGDLRVFNARETYVTGNSFVLEYMLCNVANFVHDAKVQGYSGLRVAGEINWQHSQTSGLCLCPIASASLKAIEASEPLSWMNDKTTLQATSSLSNTSIKRVLLGAGRS